MRPLPLLVCALLVAACSATPAAPDPPPAPRLEASTAQFRPDEGTRNLRVGVTNTGTTTVHLTGAGLATSGFAPHPAAVDWTLTPGQTAGFVVQYGDPQCNGRPSAPPRLRVVVDGRTRLLALHEDDPGLLARLRDRACAGERLARVAGVALRPGRATVQRDGEEWLPATVAITRRPGATGTVTAVDLGGSVLLVLRAREPGAFPVRLGARADAVRLPVLVGSAHRCDPHARGNSSQTFLLSVYVRLDGGPAQRVIVSLGAPTQRRLLALIDRDCR